MYVLLVLAITCWKEHAIVVFGGLAYSIKHDLNGKNPFFLWLNSIPWSNCTTFSLSIHLFMGCFHVLAVVNCAAINMGLQVPLSYADFNLFGYVPRNAMIL